MRQILVGLAAAAMMAAPAMGGEAGDVLREALYTGALEQGLSELEPLAGSGDPEALFGVGVIRLARSIEGLSQALYQHGFEIPRDGAALGAGLDVPLPTNPDPEQLDYEGVRSILQDFVDGLAEAREVLLQAAETGDYVIEISPLLIRIDANGDGQAEAGESLLGALALLGGAEAFGPPPGNEAPTDMWHIGFDRADAYWLAGYSQVLSAQADFLLAHDFSDFVNAIFHRIFPRAGFPMQARDARGTMIIDPQSDSLIADFVAGVHAVSWPVIEPERLRGVRERMLSIVELSRLNWAAIVAETDDNNELVPSPTQTSLLQGMPVDETRLAAWLVTLDRVEDVLEGRLMVPHWRFDRGIDVKAYFESAEETDLVNLMSGIGALPFLAEGPVASETDFRALEEAFGPDWIAYALWFN